jgi:hypothetical protein
MNNIYFLENNFMLKHTILLGLILSPLYFTANPVSVRDVKDKQPIMTRIAKGGVGLLSLGAAYFSAAILVNLIKVTSLLKYHEQPFRAISLLTAITALSSAIGISTLAHSLKGSSINIVAHASPLTKIGLGTAIGVISHNSLQRFLSDSESKILSTISLSTLFIALEASGLALTKQGASEMKKSYDESK